MRHLLLALAAVCLGGCSLDWDQRCQGSACGGASSTGSTGSCPAAPPFMPAADSATPFCSDGSAGISCSSAAGAGVGGQDGEVVAAPRYDHPFAEATRDPRTGLTFTRSTLLAEDDAGFSEADAVARCLALDAGGLHDWRLPSTPELLSIIDEGKWPHAYDEAAFALANGDSDTWTASASAIPGGAISISFYNGEAVSEPVGTRHPVRCVRGGCASGERFSSDGGVAFDRLTGLFWAQGWPSPRSWRGALAYCRALQLGGHGDWRLATVHELSTLLESGHAPPLLDARTFAPQPTGTGAGLSAWSSSPVKQNNGAESWFVNFSEGAVYRDQAAVTLNVPCVRAGP